MVRVRSRGGADTSALSLRERTTVSANFRFAVAYVAGSIDSDSLRSLFGFLDGREFVHSFGTLKLELEQCSPLVIELL